MLLRRSEIDRKGGRDGGMDGGEKVKSNLWSALFTCLFFPSFQQIFNTKTNILLSNGNTIMNEKSTLLLKLQGKLIIVSIMLIIILLNIIPVFNDDQLDCF